VKMNKSSLTTGQKNQEETS